MTCPICLEEINNSKKLQCNHEYCTECINQWTQNSCPMCRDEITNLESGLRYQAESLELYGTWKNCKIYQGNLNGFRPTIDNYLEDPRITRCVNNKHQMIINKPYGITIFCQNCRKITPFNWLN